MNVQDLLKQAGGIGTIAKELGLNPAQAASGAEALLPAILGGLKKTAATSGGESGLGSLLQSLGGGALADAVLSKSPTPVDQGNNVLGAIFGSKDVSRAVAADAAKKTGVDVSALKKMLPMVAMLVAGFMAKKGASSGASKPAGGGLLGGGMLGGLLGSVLGGKKGGASGGAGGLLSMLDADGDGNPLDDILGMLGKKK
ncbi:MAG TPA: DUF937 domain-containing protein [Spirochaetales bacterium]|nr:DUF937 domain-containing protein [Spirochaetales bacterium]